MEAPPGLPRPLGTFIGRHEDVAALTELVATCRLITIAGAGGVGKTQLALQVAARGDDQTRDGTWLVELAGVTDPDGVGDAVIREVAAGSEDGDVVEALRPCRGLLILDSCDHVLDACAQLVTRLMQACPELTVVATSREPFGLTGERIWWLSPLSAEESVELFSERARQIGTVAAASDEDAEAMAEICRRLDGLPLAIELAAARRGLLTPAEILVRLDDLFPFMRRTRDGAPRHRSLETSFDWSHRLLASEEAMLLRRLSVFAGGCYLAAAEAVCSGDGLERAGVLDLLAALVSKSLVVADQARGGTRYRLLLTTADCAGTELEAAGETDAVHDRHARWCVERAEEARHGRNGPEHDEWLARLDEDLDNFRAALTWARDEGQLEVALRLANALTWFWKTRGLAREGLGWVQWAIAQSGDAPAAWRAEAMRGAGQLLHMLGDDRSGVAFVDRSVTMFREVGDAEEGGGCVCQDTLQMCHNPLHALPALEQKVATVRTFGDPNRLAHALYNLGQARFFRGDAGGARICFAEVLSLRPRIDGEATDNALLGLARVALLVGNYDAVEPPLLEVLQHSGRIADRDTRSAALSLLSEAARARGDTRRARALLDDAMDLARAAGSPLSVGRCERILGTVELADGALGAAEALFTQALRGARSGPRLAYHELRCLLGLAEVAAASGQTGMAARWYDEAEALATTSGDDQAFARALSGRAGLARANGDAARATRLYHQALDLEADTRDLPAMTRTFEALAALAAGGGQFEKAARLLGAASAIRERHGFARTAAEQAGYTGDLELTRQGLSAEAFADALWQGSRLSVAEALAYARRGRGGRRRATSGWPSLTTAERGVVALVAQGLTNPEVGERLFISRRTVQNHLAHVFAKLGITSRRELSEIAAEWGETLADA